MSCYESIELPGFMPIYLAEIPIFNKDGELEARKPLLINRIDSIISLKNEYEAPLEAVNVWMLFPGFMNKSEGWQVQRIKAIWKGSWREKKATLTSTKIEFANGESLNLLANKPIGNAKVTWLQVL